MSRPIVQFVIALFASLAISGSANAQITAPKSSAVPPGRYATLEEQLINRLHATANEQKAYLQYLVKLVRAGKLETRLVLAIERKSLRRNRRFPFPFFERAMRYEAAKRQVKLPLVQKFVTATPSPRSL